MNAKLQIAVLVGFLFVGLGAALECYVCDTNDDGNDCKEEDPDKGELDRYISDDKDTCYVCMKLTWEDSDGDKQTLRNCASKSSYNNYDVKIDKCDSVTYDGDDSAELCICQDDKCNGSAHLVVSMVTILLATVTKLLL